MHRRPGIDADFHALAESAIVAGVTAPDAATADRPCAPTRGRQPSPQGPCRPTNNPNTPKGGRHGSCAGGTAPFTRPQPCGWPACMENARPSTGFCSEAHEEMTLNLAREIDNEGGEQ